MALGKEFASLAGSDKDRPGLIREILRKLQAEYSDDAITRNIRLHQLEILSLLRSGQIQLAILKEEIKMAFTIDITKNAMHKKGVIDGEKQGLKNGLFQKSAEVIIEMLKTGKFSVEEIAVYVNVDIRFVRKIAKENQMN